MMVNGSKEVEISHSDVHFANELIQTNLELWVPFSELNQSIHILESYLYEEDLGVDVNNAIC